MSATTERELVVLAPEATARKGLSRLRDVRLLSNLDPDKAFDIKNLFIEVSASKLPMVSDLVKVANDARYLKVLFIREDVDSKLLPQILQRADLRVMRNILVHDLNDWSIPRRIINAWCVGSEHDLVATAAVVGDSLYVLTCALEKIEVPFKDVTALKRMTAKDRLIFDIDRDGSFIHWQNSDVHIDIDALRYTVDPVWREKSDLELLAHNKNFGRAIAKTRKKYGLKQGDIPDLTDRQLRRIESGDARPSVNTLRQLASAHQMSFNQYLEVIGNELKARAR